MTKRITVALWFVLTFVAAHAYGQGLQAPRRLDVVERVHAACPGFIRQDHAFTDAVATLLNAEDARWGRNGKRGNPNDPSHDALAFRNPASPFGVSVVDIIGAAGSSSASPAWIDQTQATIDARTTGVWVRPSGVLPACLSGGSSQPPPDKPPPVDTITETLAEVRATQAVQSAMLREVRDRLIRLKAMDPPPADLGMLNEYIDDMVGNGPGGEAPNHVTDIKERIDKTRADVAALFAWLRSRRALGF